MLFYIAPDILAGDSANILVERLEFSHGNKAGNDAYPGDFLKQEGLHHEAHDYREVVQDDLIAGIPQLIAGNFLPRAHGCPDTSE